MKLKVITLVPEVGEQDVDVPDDCVTSAHFGDGRLVVVCTPLGAYTSIVERGIEFGAELSKRHERELIEEQASQDTNKLFDASWDEPPGVMPGAPTRPARVLALLHFDTEDGQSHGVLYPRRESKLLGLAVFGAQPDTTITKILVGSDTALDAGDGGEVDGPDKPLKASDFAADLPQSLMAHAGGSPVVQFVDAGDFQAEPFPVLLPGATLRPGTPLYLRLDGRFQGAAVLLQET